MREIKFRGKRVDGGEWVYGNLVMVRDGESSIYHPEIVCSQNIDTFTWEEVVPETVGELLTKVKRDNGQIEDIFEGDLIIHGERTLKVMFLRGNTTLVNKDETTGILLSFNDGKKKVGNIHDNPELLSI